MIISKRKRKRNRKKKKERQTNKEIERGGKRESGRERESLYDVVSRCPISRTSFTSPFHAMPHGQVAVCVTSTPYETILFMPRKR
jgi:hypothetical protein